MRVNMQLQLTHAKAAAHSTAIAYLKNRLIEYFWRNACE